MKLISRLLALGSTKRFLLEEGEQSFYVTAETISRLLYRKMHEIVTKNRLNISNAYYSLLQLCYHAVCPAANPEDQAHWKLYPPKGPVTSTASPIK